MGNFYKKILNTQIEPGRVIKTLIVIELGRDIYSVNIFI